jgi:hypothetical protein
MIDAIDRAYQIKKIHIEVEYNDPRELITKDFMSSLQKT